MLAVLNRYLWKTRRFWNNLKIFLQFLTSTIKDSSLFKVADTDNTPDFWPKIPILFKSYKRLQMIRYSYDEFEKGRNMYIWNLVTQDTLPWSRVSYRDRYGNDDGKCIAVKNHDRIFTKKKNDMLALIAKLVTGCLYYSIKDLVSKGKNVIFAISAPVQLCNPGGKELMELIFINNGMIKKLLNCARVIPHCKMICWYENTNKILIISKPNLLDNCNYHNVTLLKLVVALPYDQHTKYRESLGM